MQKVITITTHTNILDLKTTFVETQYPELDKLLSEGYTIKQTIETIPENQSYLFAITFILETS